MTGRLKGVHALAKDFSPTYAEALNIGSAIGHGARKTLSGAATGALTGGVSNYLAEGDLDSLLSGAAAGAGIGGVGGLLARNRGALTRLGLTAAAPAALAQMKDRPLAADYFKADPSDVLSGLYSEEKAFVEGSPEWQAYYAANPDKYEARYGGGAQTKQASMTLDDIATMEAMSGTTVGRVFTKVGTIIDAGGKYTLYDQSGKNIYGEFTKLSEAREYAEKIAETYLTPDNKIYKRRLLGRDKLLASATFQASPEGAEKTFKANELGRKKWYTSQKAYARQQAEYKKQLDAMYARHINPAHGGGASASRFGGVEGLKYYDRAMDGTIGRNSPKITSFQKLQQPFTQAPYAIPSPYPTQALPPIEAPHPIQSQPSQWPQRTTTTVSSNRPSGSGLSSISQPQVKQPVSQAVQGAEQAAARELRAVEQVATKAAPGLTAGRIAKGLGGLGALAGLGYLGYNYFKPEQSYADRAYNAAASAGSTLRQYAPLAAAVGTAAGYDPNVMGFMANASRASFEDIPSYVLRYGQMQQNRGGGGVY